MATGRYLAIGLNSVDPAAYDGWAGTLKACENDARLMASISEAKGFTGQTLLTADATSTAVLKALYKASGELAAGDLFVLSYSGHGGQVGDVTADEPDLMDETWVLWDRMLLDDELYAMWAKFKPGVRILIFSDSCHSGTVAKAMELRLMRAPNLFLMQEDQAEPVAQLEAKCIPLARSWPLYLARQPMYDSLQLVAGDAEKGAIGASVLLISGCQDNQLSYDGPVHGQFTGALKAVWANGAFTKNYQAFRDAVSARLPPIQTPNYYLAGAKNLAFEAQAPFTL